MECRARRVLVAVRRRPNGVRSRSDLARVPADDVRRGRESRSLGSPVARGARALRLRSGPVANGAAPAGRLPDAALLSQGFAFLARGGALRPEPGSFARANRSNGRSGRSLFSPA